MKEKISDAEGGRLSTQQKLAELAPGFGKRVEIAAKTFPDLQAAATAMGLGHNQLRRIMAELAVPSFPAIALLARKSGYRFEWLAFDELPEKSATRPPAPPMLPQLLTDQFVLVPELDARAAAGHGHAFEDTGLGEPEIKSVFPVPVSMIEAMGVPPDRLRLTEAKGDSMVPDIRDRDLLLLVIGEEVLHDGGIYVVNVGDDTVVKQVQIEMDGGLTLLSKNPAFAPRKIGKADRSRLSIAGRVVGALKRFV